MKLFNKYRNKDFNHIINVINMYIINQKTINIDDLKNYLIETKSFNEMHDFIEGKNAEYKIFIKNNDNKTLSLKENIDWNYAEDKDYKEYKPGIPVRLSYMERAWLYNILNDHNIRLFLDDEIIAQIQKLLIDNEHNLPYPLNNNDIYYKKLNNKQDYVYTDDEIKNFRNIYKAIKNSQYIQVTNNADNGICYKDSILIPYKIEYNCKQDTFSVTCLNENAEAIVRMFFTNLSDVKILEKKFNANDVHTTACNIFNKIRKKIIIEIHNADNALQRSAYLFSNYERQIYEQNNKIYMQIEYYKEYQYEDIIHNILFLGKYVKVISPENIVTEIKNIIKEKIQNYSK